MNSDIVTTFNPDDGVSHEDLNGDESPCPDLEDDFADFQEASPLVIDETLDVSSENHSLDSPVSADWIEPKVVENVFPSISTITKETVTNQPSTKCFPSLDNIVNQSFTKDTGYPNVNCDKSIKSDLFNDKTSQSYKIWENLLNLEESTAFRLNWESSHSFQVFLRSLKINKKNIMDNFFATAFESSTEPDELQPINSQTSSVSQCDQTISSITDKSMGTSIPSDSQISSSSASFTTMLPVSVSTAPAVTSVSNIDQNEMPQASSLSPKRVPSEMNTLKENPSSSALSSLSSTSSSSTKPNIKSDESTYQPDETQSSNVNNQLSNNLLDVTFFLNNPNFMQPCSSPKATVKVNESEQSNANIESAKPLSIISSSSTDPFHNLISHIQDASSMRTSSKPQSSPLSSSSSPSSTTTVTANESTNRIFEELPLLSFMRTKLLKYPMRDSIKD